MAVQEHIAEGKAPHGFDMKDKYIYILEVGITRGPAIRYYHDTQATIRYIAIFNILRYDEYCDMIYCNIMRFITFFHVNYI